MLFTLLCLTTIVLFLQVQQHTVWDKTIITIVPLFCALKQVILSDAYDENPTGVTNQRQIYSNYQNKSSQRSVSATITIRMHTIH